MQSKELEGEYFKKNGFTTATLQLRTFLIKIKLKHLSRVLRQVFAALFPISEEHNFPIILISAIAIADDAMAFLGLPLLLSSIFPVFQFP